jgi:hypothetical protein
LTTFIVLCSRGFGGQSVVGVPMWEAAGFLGMSEKTLRDTYGHHHSDYLRTAANAIGARQHQARRNVGCFVGKQEIEADRVAGIIENIVGATGLKPATRPL